MAEDTGIVEHTQGKKFTWYGTGESKIVASADFCMTYGVKNDITLGFANSFSAAVKTEVAIGATLAAGLSTGFEFKHEHKMEETKSNSTHALNDQVLSVGGDPINEALTQKLRTAAKVLIILQTGILASAAATTLYMARQDQAHRKAEQEQADKMADAANQQLQAANQKLAAAKTPEEKKQALADKTAAIEAAIKAQKAVNAADEDTSDHELSYSKTMENNIPGYIFSGLTTCASALTLIGTIVHILASRIRKNQHSNAPTAVLSLDTLPAAFMGIRPSLGSGSMGVSMNSGGLDLVASSADLKYDKLANPATNGKINTITCFDTMPDGNATKGARIHLDPSGDISTWGQDYTSRTSGNAVQLANVHELIQTNNSGSPISNGLIIDDNGTTVSTGPNTFIRSGLNTQGIDAAHESALMRLKPDSAVLGYGGNTVTLSNSAIELAFGATSIKMDSTGVTLGDAITILAPGAAMPSGPDLVDLKATLATLQANQVQFNASLNAMATMAISSQLAINQINSTQLAARALVDAALQTASKATGT